MASSSLSSVSRWAGEALRGLEEDRCRMTSLMPVREFCHEDNTSPILRVLRSASDCSWLASYRPNASANPRFSLFFTMNSASSTVMNGSNATVIDLGPVSDAISSNGNFTSTGTRSILNTCSISPSKGISTRAECTSCSSSTTLDRRAISMIFSNSLRSVRVRSTCSAIWRCFVGVKHSRAYSIRFQPFFKLSGLGFWNVCLQMCRKSSSRIASLDRIPRRMSRWTCSWGVLEVRRSPIAPITYLNICTATLSFLRLHLSSDFLIRWRCHESSVSPSL
mmetsp:Transcript_3527/g.7039  ORF Transcript_3527/g.7039 Transcript_3527/m.7039 type:complete len:278 (-) Transcript_3527:1147-1980(-)